MIETMNQPTTSTDWNTLLSDADLPAPELIKLLVDVYSLPVEQAIVIVETWLYDDAT